MSPTGSAVGPVTVVSPPSVTSRRYSPAWLQIARREVVGGRHAEARSRWARLAAWRPGDGEVQFQLGLCESELGRLDKALEADDDTLTVRLFPRQYADVHELQGGEQKTHTFTVAFGPDSVSEVPLDWFRNPLLPAATPRWGRKRS